MAPKKEYQAAGKSSKASSRRHNAAANTSFAEHDMSSTIGNSSNGSRRSTATTDDAAHIDNSSTMNVHEYNHSTSTTSTYMNFNRPQQTQSSFNTTHMAAHNNNDNNNGGLPVQTWLMQSMVDEPWQGMDGAYIGEGQGYSANTGDDVWNENEMEVSSMAYFAPAEEETVS